MRSRMELFEQIRRDRDREGLSTRALTVKYGVHRRAVRHALAWPVPPTKRSPVSRPAPRLGAHHALIDAWLEADQNAPKKPGSAGRAGINQMVRVVRLGASSPEEIAPPGEEGEIIALLQGDESFEGYWRRPEADLKALRHGWYFTGDTGAFDADGDLFVTGRVDDMIITGGENVSPVEIESCLSLHAAVSEVAVVGLPDERWGKVVTAFIKRSAAVEHDHLDQHCRDSGLANFKRPRRYVFVEAIPKSPVGKLLRRLLVAGEYEPERTSPSSSTGTAA